MNLGGSTFEDKHTFYIFMLADMHMYCESIEIRVWILMWCCTLLYCMQQALWRSKYFCTAKFTDFRRTEVDKHEEIWFHANFHSSDLSRESNIINFYFETQDGRQSSCFLLSFRLNHHVRTK